MIRVGITGCGKIADQHAASIQRIPGCEIVGVCDREELMAKQMCERFRVKQYFCDVSTLIEVVRPDVIHITTPPQSHFELGKQCLEAGCCVYIEKPFAMNTEETVRLIRLAAERNLKITVGHNLQFSHEAVRMREMIRKGFLGGAPIHLESIYCYDLGDERYAKALVGDKTHWVRHLPGKLLHNVISHGISKIAEFMRSDSPRVIAEGFTSEFLRSIGEDDIIDELRVMIYDDSCTTAYFTFSSQLRPLLHEFRVYGRENHLILDHTHRTVIRVKRNNYKSYIKYFVPPLIYASECIKNSGHNVGQFVRGRFHDDSGMKLVMELFYRSVVEGTPLPIPYREIVLTSRIMDAIFAQIGSKEDGIEISGGERDN